MTIKTFQSALTTSTTSSRILTSLRKLADVESSKPDSGIAVVMKSVLPPIVTKYINHE